MLQTCGVCVKDRGGKGGYVAQAALIKVWFNEYSSAMENNELFLQ